MLQLLRNHPVGLFCATLIVLRVVVEVGHRIERKRIAVDADRMAQNVAARDQVGLLLSLLLGFTLSMALSRYDLRKELTVEEATAIGTASLRAETLPDASRARIEPLFRDYVHSRLEFSRAGIDPAAVREASERSLRIQGELWDETTAAAKESPTPVTALFVASVNETIDADERRLAALENRIPLALWAMLAILSVLAAYMVGATVRERTVLPMLLPSLIIAVVMSLIADLDSPGRGLIRDQQRSIERLIPATASP